LLPPPLPLTKGKIAIDVLGVTIFSFFHCK
jgi:hypothetical protein